LTIAATESPPPTTVFPDAGGHRVGDGARADRERLHLEGAHRPFQSVVPAPATALA